MSATSPFYFPEPVPETSHAQASFAPPPPAVAEKPDHVCRRRTREQRLMEQATKIVDAQLTLARPALTSDPDLLSETRASFGASTTRSNVPAGEDRLDLPEEPITVYSHQYQTTAPVNQHGLSAARGVCAFGRCSDFTVPIGSYTKAVDRQE
jgi:hypothetical protein